MQPELKNAIVTVLAMIDKLQPRHLDVALEEIDLNEDAWKEELDIVKKAVDWVDEDVEEEDDEEDDD